MSATISRFRGIIYCSRRRIDMIKRMAICILILLVLCVSVGGCSKNNQEKTLGKNKTDSSEYTEYGEKIATKEFLVNAFGFTDSDFNGIDVEKVLTRYEVSEEALKESGDSKEFIIESLKKLQKMLDEEGKPQIKPLKPDYSYLVKAKEFKGKYPSFDNLKYFTEISTGGNGGASCFIDFKKNILLFADGSLPIYEDIDKYNKKVELSKERKENIIKALKKAGIDKWNYKYEVKKYSPEGGSHWYLGMEFEDGTIISYSGSNDGPDTLDQIYEEIYK
jgi:hypothetical protein